MRMRMKIDEDPDVNRDETVLSDVDWEALEERNNLACKGTESDDSDEYISDNISNNLMYQVRYNANDNESSPINVTIPIHMH